MFADADYFIELGRGSLFEKLSRGTADAPTANLGRNHELKRKTARALAAGEDFATFMQTLMAYDLANGDLFGDQTDPQMAGHTRQENALRFIQSNMASINRKRKSEGLAPQEFKTCNDLVAQREPEKGLTFSDYCASRFIGEPPPIEWVVANVFKTGAAYLLAGMGEVGKSFLALNLAVLIAYHRSPIMRPRALGGTVVKTGTVVMLSIEDSQDTFHQRIADIDKEGLRFQYPGKLILISLADAGGTRPFVISGKNGFETTDFYKDIRRQLLEIDDLAAVFFDTGQGLFQCDFNSDPAAGQYCAGVLQELATITGAAVITTHHMRKPSAEITTPQQAREGIRGTTAIVDGLRGAYALWPCPYKESRRIAADLGLEWQSNLIVKGAIVKSNSAESRHITTFIRNEFGLLEDRTGDRTRRDHSELLSILEFELISAAEEGKPFFKTGVHGVFKRKSELPPELREQSRRTLEQMIDDLESEGRITISKGGISC